MSYRVGSSLVEVNRVVAIAHATHSVMTSLCRPELFVAIDSVACKYLKDQQWPSSPNGQSRNAADTQKYSSESTDINGYYPEGCIIVGLAIALLLSKT